MRFLYMVTRGASDATAASIPLHLAANGSLEVGHEVTVVFAGDGAEIVIDNNADTMEGLGVPPVKDLLAKLKEHSVPVYVWKACAVARGATEESLAVVNGSWTTPPEAAKMCEEADKVLPF